MKEILAKFLVGSWFLRESFQYCTQRGRNVTNALNLLGTGENNNEWVHYATGIEVGDWRTVDRIVKFSFAQQSVAYVESDAASSRDALIQMAEFGYRLHAVMHSHPGHGANATHPSGIDYDHQRRLERGGYVVVSGIYSRDGFVRFFTDDIQFQIEIFGEGVKQHESNLFELV